MIIEAIAIDDEPNALQVISFHASKVPFLNLKATFTDAFKAIPFLQSNSVDLVFLDIKMPDISGIELVKTLPRFPMVVFTTAYSEYAVHGFDLDAVDYLLKPFSLARFTKACNKVLELKTNKSGEERKFVFLKTGYEDEKVLLDEIKYVEAEGNYLAFILKGRKILTRLTMHDAVNMLPSEKFLRIHRSYIVSIDKIEKLGRQEIWIEGKSIPIGSSFEGEMEELRRRLI